MDVLALLKRAEDDNGNRFENCTSVTDFCPVEATIYGYYPNLGANAFFLALFAICCIVQTFLGLRFRTWTYLIALFFGALGEAIGYIGRVMMNSNPWSETGFQTQICCLIIAPAFIAAGVYLTLKHIILEIGPQYSRLPPRYYTWIFICCDILSLVLQGAGGGLAASADGDQALQDTGNDMMMAGIVWQVITLLVFGLLVGIYALTVHRGRASLSASAVHLLSSTRFKLFTAGITLAYLTIFVRCVYRIAEMAGGWQNEIMQNEDEFIVLDSVMIAVATIALTVCHPGIAFKEMVAHGKGIVGGVEVVVQEKKVRDVESSPEESPSRGPERKKGVKGWFGGKS